MTSDLIFSVLPREGKEPIAHDELKVQKIAKESALRELSDEEQELHLEEREARQQQQAKNKKEQQAEEEDTQQTEEEAKSVSEADNNGESTTQKDDDDKGFKHLDIYV